MRGVLTDLFRTNESNQQPLVKSAGFLKTVQSARESTFHVSAKMSEFCQKENLPDDREIGRLLNAIFPSARREKYQVDDASLELTSSNKTFLVPRARVQSNS